jgi:hypothetical protein
MHISHFSNPSLANPREPFPKAPHAGPPFLRHITTDNRLLWRWLRAFVPRNALARSASRGFFDSAIGSQPRSYDLSKPMVLPKRQANDEQNLKVEQDSAPQFTDEPVSARRVQLLLPLESLVSTFLQVHH